jgi:hypothetical protein
LNKLPSKVLIGGLEVSINTDFRTSIEFEGLIKQYDLEDEEEQKEFRIEILKLYYPVLSEDFEKSDMQTKLLINHIADNVGEAINQIMWFHRCGEDINTEQVETSVSKEKIIDYEYDSKKIYAAFLDQYRKDFQKEEYMHWWEFKALIEGLKEDSEIRKVMSIRALDVTKVSKEQREYYTKLKKIVKIPLPKEEVESKSNFAKLMRNGGDLSELEE